jgi:Ricin-type beta-trefoil lectin domain
MRLCSLALALLLAAPAAAQEIRDDFYYRIGSDFAGPEKGLGVVNGGWLDQAAIVEPAANVSSQFWRVGIGSGGTVRLTTFFKGPQFCLDILKEAGRVGEVGLTHCRESETQRWSLRQERARFQLVSNAGEKEQCVEMVTEGLNANRLRMTDCGFFGNQLWTFAITDQPVE